MNELIQTILSAVTILVTVVVYAFLIKVVLPRFLVKRKFSYDGHLGRGLKKYKSENGRAIVYEPHPSVRKYIKQYALVSDGGLKYLECNVDEGVNRIIYNVVMLDRKDKVLDVIEVEEVTAKRSLTQSVYLHPDTSYIALIVTSVNKEKLPNSDISYYTKKDIAVFGLMTAYLTLIASLIVCGTAHNIIHSLGMTAASGFFLPSLLAAIIAGVLSVLILIMTCNDKNVRVK